MDTSTGAGIVRAKNMNLVPSRLADIIFTPLLHEAAQLFNNEGVPQQKGMIFCLIRHPLERAVSLFHYLQKASLVIMENCTKTPPPPLRFKINIYRLCYCLFPNNQFAGNMGTNI